MTLKIPNPFPTVRTVPLKAGATLHRFHDHQFKGAQFNPGLGSPSRFAPLKPASQPQPVGTLYAANTFDCGVYESIFNDIPPQSRGRRTPVGWSRIENIDHSELTIDETLMIAHLQEPDLKRMRTSRKHLIDTGPKQYLETAAWAAALYDAHPHVQGLCWTSAKDDSGAAYIFFADRLNGPGDIRSTSTTRVRECEDRLEKIRAAGHRLGCVMVF